MFIDALCIHKLKIKSIKKLFLLFSVAPEIESQGGDANLKRGQRFVLKCLASGTPTPTVEWKRGGEVDPRQQVLVTYLSPCIIDSRCPLKGLKISQL